MMFIKYAETEMEEDEDKKIVKSITDSITSGHKKEEEDFRFIIFLNTFRLK